MRGGVLLIIVGILLAYLGVSGKYKCFTIFAKCLGGSANCSCNETATVLSETAQPSVGGKVVLPKLPPLPKIPSVINA